MRRWHESCSDLYAQPRAICRSRRSIQTQVGSQEADKVQRLGEDPDHLCPSKSPSNYQQQPELCNWVFIFTKVKFKPCFYINGSILLRSSVVKPSHYFTNRPYAVQSTVQTQRLPAFRLPLKGILTQSLKQQINKQTAASIHTNLRHHFPSNLGGLSLNADVTYLCQLQTPAQEFWSPAQKSVRCLNKSLLE